MGLWMLFSVPEIRGVLAIVTFERRGMLGSDLMTLVTAQSLTSGQSRRWLSSSEGAT